MTSSPPDHRDPQVSDADVGRLTTRRDAEEFEHGNGSDETEPDEVSWIPKYEVGDFVGKGGMGKIFRGVCHGADGFSRPVAIKRLRSSKYKLREMREQLGKEAKLGAALSHPNIVEVFDYTVDDEGRLCLVMALIDGINLDTLMHSGQLPIAVCVYTIREVLQGLAHAHRHGIIHRDITPGNILISRAGTVHITDFGLAQDLTVDPAPKDGGTPGFMSPEAVQEDIQDGRSDLFSVGVIFYEMLTGARAFPGTNPHTRMARTIATRLSPVTKIRPDVPAAISDLIARMVAMDPDDRVASAVEVLDALPACKYGSEDLAMLMVDRKLAPPWPQVPTVPSARPVPAMAEMHAEPDSEPARKTVRSPALADRRLVAMSKYGYVPEAVPEPISQDPVFEPRAHLQRDDEPAELPQSQRDDEPAELPQSQRDDEPAEPPRSQRDDARAEAPQSPQGDEQAELSRSRLHGEQTEAPRSRWRRYVALAALLVVCGVIGQHVVRRAQRPDTAPPNATTQPNAATQPSAAPPSSAATGASAATEAAAATPPNALPRPGDGAPAPEATRAEPPAPMAAPPRTARAEAKKRPANRTRAPVRTRTTRATDTDLAAADVTSRAAKRADTADKAATDGPGRNWADGIDPAALDPVERFSVPVGSALPGELTVKEAP